MPRFPIRHCIIPWSTNKFTVGRNRLGSMGGIVISGACLDLDR